MRVACLQFDVQTCQREANSLQALTLARFALQEGAEILIFPELFLTGFCYSPQGPEEPPYHSLDPFRELVKDHGCLVMGSMMGGRLNLGFALERGGLQTRAKVHPFGREREYFQGGRTIAPLQTGRGMVGLQICYDLRFPEVARKLCAAGAEMLVTVAQFPAVRLDHWRTLVKARAIENQIHHLACNSCGQSAGGQSMMVDPRGRVMASAESDREVLLAEVDLAERDEARGEVTCWQDRRPEVY
ncbi:MAG: nitrilase [Methanosarcinales archaeon]|nr:nitrilase [Methanosarcinales archaeon]